jgi:hypothetical protein
MGPAPLPRCAVQHRCDRRFEALVGVAGDQPDSGQAAGDQATKERRPACPVLGAAQLQPEQLPVPVGVTGSGDQHRGVAHPPAFADLHAQRVDPHKPIRAGVQRPAPPRVDHLVELSADPRHLALGDPLQPHRPGHVIDPAGRHPLHITLHHHCGQRPFSPTARLQDRREVAALAQPRDLKLHRADPGVPVPGPVAVAVGHPLRGALTVLSADLGRDLDLHERLGEGADSLAQEVDIGVLGLAQQLIQLHLGHDHRAPPRRGSSEPSLSRMTRWSSHHTCRSSRRVAAPECLHSCSLPLLWPGFYTTSRDSNDLASRRSPPALSPAKFRDRRRTSRALFYRCAAHSSLRSRSRGRSEDS